MQGRNLAEIITGAVVLLVAAAFVVFALGQSGRSIGSGAAGSITLTAKFDRIDGLTPGADVRIGGVKVGSVVDQRIDPHTYLAILRLRVDPGIGIPNDSSAEITSESLLGGKYVALVPGGSDTMLRDGQEVTITQSAVSLESLLGRFIFSVTELTAANAREQGGNGGGATNNAAPAAGGAAPAAPRP
ncbi:outer membrane lipid asymmetry maintenance protein MlaD [Pseudoroseomonas cervicalis]|uniref:outer membrane lipid asymmetry maintenance protein MlaD n=1 Tax=Teichococcus cervicalis TaxID=204525 RepID=UPI0022F1D66F|nr:outer membrane lipid asymmetry maintenance protein MlaD [Pseudoroseomonas cervicalis]WBV42850.1 outer membrane lipid asymmetry maintenance protein MlaD [Pseudoroseomonas cervicalis]